MLRGLRRVTHLVLVWKLGGIKTVIIGFFVWTNSTFSLLKCCWKTASKQSSNVRLEEWGVFVISLDQSISRKCEKERVESCSTSWTKTFCDGWISGLLRVNNDPKHISKIHWTTHFCSLFACLLLIQVNFLLYLLLLTWLYFDLHENSVFAKISRLLDSTQGCCTVTSQTEIMFIGMKATHPRGKSSDEAINHFLKYVLLFFLATHIMVISLNYHLQLTLYYYSP